MKQLRKMLVLAVFAVMMTVMPGVETKAGQVNATETVEWGKGYDVDFDVNNNDTPHSYNVIIPSSGKFAFTLNVSAPGYNRLEFYLYDESGKEIKRESSIGDGMHNFGMELLEGSYILKINKSAMYGSVQGSFIPTFTPSNETVSESCRYTNNQLTTASSHTAGSTTKAHLALNDNTDIYKVKINKDSYITVTLNSDIAALNMSMSCSEKGVQYSEENIPFGRSIYKYFVPKGTYYISFMSYGEENTGTYTFSTKLSGMTKSKVRAVKNLKGKQAKITWVKKNDVDGYQVQVAQNKRFTKGRKSEAIAVSSYFHVNSHTFTKLKKGKTYYARVRTYKLVNGKKYYSDWSSAKKVKIRK